MTSSKQSESVKGTNIGHAAEDEICIAGGNINEKPTIIAPKASKPQEASAVPSYLAKKIIPPPSVSADSAQQVGDQSPRDLNIPLIESMTAVCSNAKQGNLSPLTEKDELCLVRQSFCLT